MSFSGSLRFRLYATATIAIALALGIAAVALTSLFHQQVQLRLRAELGNHMLQLISRVNLTGTGALLNDEILADPRFEKPYSGLYWTVQADGSEPVNSRSLWDQALVFGEPRSAPGRPAYFEAPGPDGQSLYVAQETIIAQTAAGDRKVVVNVGVDRSELDQAVADFRRDLLWYLAIIAALLMSATWVQVGIGLKPLDALRSRISDIRSATAGKIEGAYPSEVQPLVEEINELLAGRDDSLKKARGRAADMAHALRTPLTVMGSLASDLERDGKPEIAAELRQQTEVMRRNVERELARARMASERATVQFSPREALERMVSAMQRMPRGGEIDWQLQRASCNGMVAADGDDLLELFGNLLDNARKWATSVVRVSIQSGEQSLHVVIEDDGLGVADELLNAIAARGERLDETR